MSTVNKEHFKVSSHLKDIIGRDLVTNEFVAFFELVKNSFDARATSVEIGFDLEEEEIWIADDGKGMSEQTVRDRWLFVAYSAKADGTEDQKTSSDYRDKIRPAGQYAGSKGIGRFSCDTLGATLSLFSKDKESNRTVQVDVDWESFEKNSKDLFEKVGISLREVEDLPQTSLVNIPRDSGTVLKIKNLRILWDAKRIAELKDYLGKLIDPFGTTEDIPVSIYVNDNTLDAEEKKLLEGPISNDIKDLLDDKTTRIFVRIDEQRIKTELIDRGRAIYRISENNPFESLRRSEVSANIYYLNRAAKATFTRRMGVRPVEFGSIFLFLNGFRIFPIGEETDDTFGLNRRKQQGSSRYLGTRDVMGRVDVSAPARLFREASSRDSGLILDANTRDLYDAIRRKAIFRLEKYVVGVTWQDKVDLDREDASGLNQTDTRARVASIIAQLASTTDIELDYYDPEIVDIFEEDARSAENSLKAVVAIAESRGDHDLLRRVEETRARIIELEKSEREAAEVARQALRQKAQADERIARLQRQARYLASTQDMTVEQMGFLLHQVIIYAGHIGSAVDRALGLSSEIKEAATDLASGGVHAELADAAASIRSKNKRLSDDLDYIHLENDRLTAVARFASNARFDLETDSLRGDVIEFLNEYVNQVRSGRDGVDSISFSSNELSHETLFRPTDLVVVVDNLMDNSRKHGARRMEMNARRNSSSKLVEVVVTDDGRGIDEDRVDIDRIFDKGYSSTRGGTGLGLYHARLVLQNMKGDLLLDPDREAGRASFVIILPK